MKSFFEGPVKANTAHLTLQFLRGAKTEYKCLSYIFFECPVQASVASLTFQVFFLEDRLDQKKWTMKLFLKAQSRQTLPTLHSFFFYWPPSQYQKNTYFWITLSL